MKIKEINIAGYNPRKDLKPGDVEYEKLKRSILEFNLVEPLIVNKRGNVLVGGHQRLKVLQDMGHTEVEVSLVDLPLEKEKALNIALNKVQGDWDVPALKDLVKDISGEFTGFSTEELEGLLGSKIVEADPEMVFTEELFEEHNYLVLYFDNSLDWQTACDKLDVKTVYTNDSRKGYERKGVGRVLKGSDVIAKIN